MKALVLAQFLVSIVHGTSDLNMALVLGITDSSIHSDSNCETWSYDDGICLVKESERAMRGLAHLAVKHFNSRNVSMVKELAQLENCGIQIKVATVIDEGNSAVVTLNRTLREILEKNIDVIVGPKTSSRTIPVAQSAGVLNIPVFGPTATSAALDDPSLFQHCKNESHRCKRGRNGLQILEFERLFNGGGNLPSGWFWIKLYTCFDYFMCRLQHRSSRLWF